MATAEKTETPVKKTSITFDQAMEKIINTLKLASDSKKIRNLGLTVYRSGFTVTIDGKICERNMKTVQQFNSIVNQL